MFSNRTISKSTLSSIDPIGGVGSTFWIFSVIFCRMVTEIFLPKILGSWENLFDPLLLVDFTRNSCQNFFVDKIKGSTWSSDMFRIFLERVNHNFSVFEKKKKSFFFSKKYTLSKLNDLACLWKYKQISFYEYQKEKLQKKEIIFSIFKFTVSTVFLFSNPPFLK